LPVYELTLPEAGRNAMLANPRKDVEVEGQFHFTGIPWRAKTDRDPSDLRGI